MFEEIINNINGVIWSNAMIILCAGAGIYFSIATGFLQFSNFRDMLRLLFTGGSTEKGVSSFQAFAIALCGRIGTGNIAGVATAIAMGDLVRFFGCGQLTFLVVRRLILRQHLDRFTRK